MRDLSVTKNGIHLLGENAIGFIIQILERNHPGWWYSVSQKADGTTLSLGPHPDCRSTKDRLLSVSDIYNRGFIQSNPNIPAYSGLDTNQYRWFDAAYGAILDNIKAAYDTLVYNGDTTTIPNRSSSHRIHTSEDRGDVVEAYWGLKKTLITFEDAGYCVDELYLGSCGLSADVSLRGIDQKGVPFDLSHDIKDQGKIADALWTVLDDIIFLSDYSKPKEEQDRGDP